jgi:hypothetical protein
LREPGNIVVFALLKESKCVYVSSTALGDLAPQEKKILTRDQMESREASVIICIL